MTEERETLIEHLEELRRRLIVCLAAVAAGSVVAYGQAGTVLGWLSRQAGGLVFLAPTEAFLARLQIAFFGGLFLAVPVILFEAWAFAVKALTPKERRALVWILPASYALFVLGASLALFLVVPKAVAFLIACGGPDLRPMLSVRDYLEFVLFLGLAFGFIFQLPLAIFFLHWLGLVTAFQLSAWRRYVYLGAFAVAALLTPGPDVFSQVALAVPGIFLYEVSLAILRWGPAWQAVRGPGALAPAHREAEGSR